MNPVLGINTGFAVNRYAEPEDWTRIVGEELGLKRVQLTADMLNPSLPGPILRRYIKRINKCCARQGISITSTFTGGFTRVNHFAHPDPEIRAYWIEWFKRFADITVDLGAQSMGSHFGILTIHDDADPKRRERRTADNVRGWHTVGKYAKKKGLDFLSWETMSIRREHAATISTARKLQKQVNHKGPIPFKMVLDLDHGDWSSKNPADLDPYAWIAAFAKETAFIHLKQTRNDSSGHGPFTAKNNKRGHIRPAKVLAALNKAGAGDIELIFEHSFKERQPADSTVIPVLKESVAYWRPMVKA